MLVIVVEDQMSEREFFHGLLLKHGYEVIAFKDSLSAMEHIRVTRADVILIDYNLQGGPNGLSLARQVRKLYPADIIVMISAYAGVQELVEAIQISVDDFIIKPTTAKDILKRLDEAIMRRREWFPQQHPPHIVTDVLELDMSARTAVWYGEPLSLTPSEFVLLVHLASNPDRVFGYSELYALSRGERLPPAEARTRIKSHLVNLRAKLEKNGRPQAIHNVRGMGFKWHLPALNEAV
ncbi:MAG: response regulator transcription factor [Anaerolineae bacterium]|nr:response regulator transcription factor [Anaerolineae bacterium]